jgi:hypothetical protein
MYYNIPIVLNESHTVTDISYVLQYTDSTQW